MIDLHFAEGKKVKKFNCDECSDKKKAFNKCETPGFEHFKTPKSHMQIDSVSLKYLFCPGKAQWYPHITECFAQCEIAMETGILPKPGLLEDQTPLFNDVFLFFLQRWKTRRYLKTWQDVMDYTPKVLEMIGKMFKGK